MQNSQLRKNTLDSIEVIYNDDINNYKKRLNEISRNTIDNDILFQIIKLERRINEFSNLLSKLNVGNNQKNNSNLENELNKIDSEFLMIRRNYINLITELHH
jgi:hypothetical protein